VDAPHKVTLPQLLLMAHHHIAWWAPGGFYMGIAGNDLALNDEPPDQL